MRPKTISYGRTSISYYAPSNFATIVDNIRMLQVSHVAVGKVGVLYTSSPSFATLVPSSSGTPTSVNASDGLLFSNTQPASASNCASANVFCGIGNTDATHVAYSVRVRIMIVAAAGGVNGLSFDVQSHTSQALRVWVDGSKVIDKWTAGVSSGTIPATLPSTAAGEAMHVVADVKFGLQNNGVDALSIKWRTGGMFAVIPSGSMYSAIDVVGSPFPLTVE